MSFAKPISLGYLHCLGDLDVSVFNPKRWVVQAKYNGWRTKVGQTGLPISKNNNDLAPHHRDAFEFQVAELRRVINWEFCDYVDCEFMCLTPLSCPVGTIIAYDCMGGESESFSQADRSDFMWLQKPCEFEKTSIKVVCSPEEYDVDHYKLINELERMLKFNEEHDLLYEGFVFKKLSALYGQNRAWYKLRFQEQIINI